ncbi:MAG TPA: aminotransferase class V-fold PLP-dependent enzyme [Actinotalea sp.]|nr:aminotransferase class V-fold PLP-dependent enzyme [Actinotalea sp.]
MAPSRTYLDAGGRAPLHPAARRALMTALDDGWADPRRLHSEGRRARMLLDQARAELAEGLGCRVEELVLTANHTASLRTAVAAVAHARRRLGSTVVVSAVERAAVLAAAAAVDPALAPVPVDPAGRVVLDAWGTAVTAPGVVLAALQDANGEVGTRQPLDAAHAATRAAGVPLLVDAGASVGHAPVGPAWDLLAADPGDWGGPAGVGVLAVRARVRAAPPGAQDEQPWSPGGVSVAAAVGAAASLTAVLADLTAADERRRRLLERVRRAAARVPDVEVVAERHDPALPALPHVLTFSCLFVDGEALVGELDRRGFAVGSGSACTSSTLEPSHVLAAMGVLTHGNVRVTLPREVTEAQVDAFCAVLAEAVASVRRMLGVTGL